MKKSVIAVFTGMVLSATGASAASLFSEDFGNLPTGTTITVDNTSLTYARVGTGAGAHLTANNPGSFSGASASMLSTSTSLTGMGATNGSYASFELGTLAFSFRTPATFAVPNDLYAFVGSGTTFSGNSVFSGNDLAAGFAVSAGQLRTRNRDNAWEDIGVPLSADTAYDLHIVFNASDAPVLYGEEALDAGTADVWLNGMRFGNDVSIRDAVDVTAFRLYATGSSGATPFEIDNLRLDNVAIAVPEPSMLSVGGIGCLLAMTAALVRRRV